jgi:hypothetical protein
MDISKLSLVSLHIIVLISRNHSSTGSIDLLTLFIVIDA